jgi:hypothetical protein
MFTAYTVKYDGCRTQQGITDFLPGEQMEGFANHSRADPPVLLKRINPPLTECGSLLWKRAIITRSGCKPPTIMSRLMVDPTTTNALKGRKARLHSPVWLRFSQAALKPQIEKNPRDQFAHSTDEGGRIGSAGNAGNRSSVKPPDPPLIPRMCKIIRKIARKRITIVLRRLQYSALNGVVPALRNILILMFLAIALIANRAQAAEGDATKAFNFLQDQLGKPHVDEVWHDSDADLFHWRGPKTGSLMAMPREKFEKDILIPYMASTLPTLILRLLVLINKPLGPTRKPPKRSAIGYKKTVKITALNS